MISQKQVNELDPLQLRYEMNWTLERLAFELDYSVSAALKWSAGIHSPSKRVRKQAYQVWMSYHS